MATMSPIGAAALPPPMKTKEKVEQGKGTADHLMPLGYLLQLNIVENFTKSVFHHEAFYIANQFIIPIAT